MKIEKLRMYEGQVVQIIFLNGQSQTIDSFSVNDEANEVSGYTKRGGKIVVSADIVAGVVPFSGNSKRW